MLGPGCTRVLPEEAHVRNRGVLLLALLIAAVLAAGSVYAFVNAGDGSGPTIDALPSPSATASESPTPSPTPSVTPSETSTPTPTPTATQGSSPRATPKATSSATRTSSPRSSSSTTYAYPKPSRDYDRLQLTITANPEHGTVGETFRVVGTATDGDGRIYFTGMSWGDGSSEPAGSNPQHCKSWPPLTSRPGPYQPRPDKKRYAFDHQYLTPGDYTITFHVRSVNEDCRPNGPKREDRVLSVVVHVAAATA
jgi:hypothetical protein